MLKKHPFILKPGNWLGDGKITLSMMKEKLPFYTRWKVPLADDEGRITCVQEIQITGLAEVMHNEFNFSKVTPNGFLIELENQSLGKVVGKGMIRPEKLGWEFRMSHLGFEGFEFYEVGDEPDTYNFHAEYATADDFRTVIHGRIWKHLD